VGDSDKKDFKYETKPKEYVSGSKVSPRSKSSQYEGSRIENKLGDSTYSDKKYGAINESRNLSSTYTGSRVSEDIGVKSSFAALTKDLDKAERPKTQFIG
jgi:hypothetical protein